MILKIGNPLIIELLALGIDLRVKHELGKELSRQVGSGPPVENYKDWIRRRSDYY